ncbi:MAG: FMN-binding protein [Bacillota bacterium]
MRKVWYFVSGFAVLVVVILIALMSGMGAVKGLTIGDVDLGKVADGVHEGTFKQGRWNYTVAVTVKDYKITGIELISGKDPGSQRIFATERDRVIAAQSPNVDTVSGATVTSKALLKAIENALVK